MDGTRLRILTHKSDILKQVGVDPNRPLHRDDRQAPKDQPDNRERDEQAHETRDTDREVPDTNPELDGPEGDMTPASMMTTIAAPPSII